MNLSILINTDKDGIFIIGSQLTSSKFWCFYVPKIISTLTNSADTDEIQHFVALHLGLNCSFRSQRFNIHVQFKYPL